MIDSNQKFFHCSMCHGRRYVNQNGTPAFIRSATTRLCDQCEGKGHLTVEDRERISKEPKKEIKQESTNYMEVEEMLQIEDVKMPEPEKAIEVKKKRGRPKRT